MTVAATKQLTDEVVYEYWESKAAEHREDRIAAIRDEHYHDLEIDTISRFLRPSDHVLDIGCANGYTSVAYARHAQRVVGADYSPRMIEAARVRLGRQDDAIAQRTTFQVEDARNLSFADETFSRVIMQRCLINIPDRDQQVQAAMECARVLKRGELFLLAEVTLQGHERVNEYRERFGLPRLKTHWHNTYVDEPVFLEAIRPALELKETIRFGMYGFLSKIVHTLLVEPAEPAFDARINEVAARIAREIPDFDGCSHQVLFVLQKK